LVPLAFGGQWFAAFQQGVNPPMPCNNQHRVWGPFSSSIRARVQAQGWLYQHRLDGVHNVLGLSKKRCRPFFQKTSSVTFHGTIPISGPEFSFANDGVGIGGNAGAVQMKRARFAGFFPSPAAFTCRHPTLYPGRPTFL